ncbi:energy-coupling factor transporter transmembrane component T [Nocardioides gilvus]|uniref:energy-coupling factor transporter transmembrane component T n=1 Tax=Nocardioides gilvus TaxID=1735589 RepID=UPI000D742844|nr:energy-coupling factor transporter transmembrane component T [Nocardioides gilvus]
MSTSPKRVRFPRELHPVAWWTWAVGIAAAASMTTSPWLLGLLVAVTCLVVVSCRGDGPWARAFKLYLWLAVITVVIRVFFRVLLGGSEVGHVLFRLPSVPLPEWAAGIQLLGPATREQILAGLYDGMQLACILLAFGAANALANPKRLLKVMPPALYEIGSAMVVAVSVLPQLVDSARRVKHAQELRGGEPGRIRGLRRLLVPVLEDAFDRSLALAAGMDARGYGRAGGTDPKARRVTGALMVTALLGTCVGVYGFLDSTTPAWIGLPMLGLGALCAVLGMASAGRRVQRTRYRPEKWQQAELLIAGSAVLTAVLVWWVGRTSGSIAHPGVEVLPQITLLALCAPLVALVPILVAPPAPTVANRTVPRSAPDAASRRARTPEEVAR